MNIWIVKILLAAGVNARGLACSGVSYCEASTPSVEEYLTPRPDAELVHVSLYLRHGDRTPLSTPDYSIWEQLLDRDSMLDLDPLYFPEENAGIQGLLTIRGQQQLRRLGDTVREMYRNHLDFRREDSITIQSTPLARTYLSAQAFLQGLYPQGHSISIQPAVLIPPLVKLEGGSVCGGTDEYFCQACYPEIWTTAVPDHHCRLEGEGEAFALEDVPDDHHDFANLFRESLLAVQFPTLESESTADLASTSSGRMYVIVAHGTTISSLLAALKSNLEPKARPPYAANLFIEVWRLPQERNALRVRAIYNGTTVKLPWCGDGETCPLLDFLRHISKRPSEDQV